MPDCPKYLLLVCFNLCRLPLNQEWLFSWYLPADHISMNAPHVQSQWSWQGSCIHSPPVWNRWCTFSHLTLNSCICYPSISWVSGWAQWSQVSAVGPACWIKVLDTLYFPQRMAGKDSTSKVMWLLTEFTFLRLQDSQQLSALRQAEVKLSDLKDSPVSHFRAFIWLSQSPTR